LVEVRPNYKNATGDNSQITLNFSIEVENM
jgi:hypothetical protein